MFGFGRGSLKKYNGSVDKLLNGAYAIKTRDNVKFPGALAYLDLIDNAWNAKMNEDEGAMYIATLYCIGLLEIDDPESAAIADQIRRISSYNLNRGLISDQRAEKLLAAIEDIPQLDESTESKEKPEVEKPKSVFGMMQTAENNLNEAMGLSLDILPDPLSVKDGFMTSAPGLSQIACTALLSRLATLNWLIAVCQIRDSGGEVETSSLSMIRDLCDYSIELENFAEDSDLFLARTIKIDELIYNSFSSFEIHIEGLQPEF